jgi:hypothetical protein
MTQIKYLASFTMRLRINTHYGSKPLSSSFDFFVGKCRKMNFLRSKKFITFKTQEGKEV